MPTVTLQEARASLPDLIYRLAPGEEVTIIENGRVVGRLLPGEPPPARPSQQPEVTAKPVVAVDSNATTALRPPPGLGKGFITIVSEDDGHLIDFADYMP